MFSILKWIRPTLARLESVRFVDEITNDSYNDGCRTLETTGNSFVQMQKNFMLKRAWLYFCSFSRVKSLPNIA